MPDGQGLDMSNSDAVVRIVDPGWCCTTIASMNFIKNSRLESYYVFAGLSCAGKSLVAHLVAQFALTIVNEIDELVRDIFRRHQLLLEW